MFNSQLLKVCLVCLCLVESCEVLAGGYVPPNGTQLKPSTSIAIPGTSQTGTTGGDVVMPVFNNATLSSALTVGETNNNLIKTPSTADPVSTVTGNNYHDETDFVIKGKAGLNMAFTRTFNEVDPRVGTDLLAV